MKKRFIVLSLFCLLLPSIRPTTGQYPCPEPEDISPCTCFTNEEGVHAECYQATSSQDIFFAFNDAVWPVTNLTSFNLGHNYDVEEFSERIFGDISFEEITGVWSVVRSIHPSALLPSKDRLKRITMVRGALEQFPWDYMQHFTQLTSLEFQYNRLTGLPPVQSDSLEFIDQNQVSDIQPGFFLGLTSLEEISCYPCPLGPTLRNGTLAFDSPYLEYVEFPVSGISSLESHAITGLRPDTIVELSGNPISELTEGTFRPMLEILSQGDGSISLGSHIVCDCTIAWLVLNPNFHGSIIASCADGGLPIQELNPEDFADCNVMGSPMAGDFPISISSD
ncbi:unnamed protein product [Darwinula stevensoni]|uniref:Leucine-rich repeat domain-containing protein n=1 Tax=Darwinula stevensoni TaxID=69355 RepID=A0A7R8XG31_9CRUS|nr:unnamed protein product [Darwinula stevensoni]CAG0889356.1 unnamed protein product [Darwinula stevensoni]